MNWRDPILQHFTEPTHRLNLVADPDGLLLEEELLAIIRARGFDLLPFDEGIVFRYAYEANYRQHWDDGQSTSLVVILRSTEVSLQTLPYDLLQSGRVLRFNLPELFPKLSYPVVKTLDPAHFQPLYEAHQIYHGPELGDQATKLFVLKHVFGLVPELINTPLDLLKLLLARHTRSEIPPASLDAVLLAHLALQPRLTSWPLASLLRNTAEFFNFLQTHWLNFLAIQQSSELLAVQETGVTYAAQSVLPLDDPQVRGYLQTLFLEGKLQPVSLPAGWQITAEWTKVGLVLSSKETGVQRFKQLLALLRDNVPPINSLHKTWLQFADQWTELVVLRHRYADQLAEAIRQEFARLHLEVEAQFADWLLARYHTLHNQPFQNMPVMGHHIPGYLAAYRRQQAHEPRLALIVVDGLALDQWQIIRRVWKEQAQPWTINAGGLFAWIPTLTSIARQAIFAGQPPYLFPDSWQTTHQEAKRWQRFWQEHDLPPTAIGYARNLGNNFSSSDPTANSAESFGEAVLEPEVLALIESPRIQVLGLVVNTVDNIGHGMQLGTAGMHQQIELWLTHRPYLTHLITKLLTENFTVFLTADHGNIWARGIGRPNEGVLVETKGQRARLYTDPVFLDLARQQFSEALEWPNLGLPAQLRVLLAPQLTAFLDVNTQAVCHGGIALEEVVVPFVQITRSQA
jgi:hypothetical protein